MKLTYPVTNFTNRHANANAKVWLVLLLAAGLIFSSMGECQAGRYALNDKTFYMVINRPRGTPLYEWTRLIYTEVFRRLNINIAFDYHPLERASIQINTGKADGEPARIFTYAERFTNLIRVDEVVFSMIVVAYTNAPDTPELNGWESLKNTPYFVEYPRGMKMCRDNLSKVVKPDQLHAIKASSQGLARLAKNRIDIYVDDLNSTLPLIQDPNRQLKGKIRIAGVMASTPLFMYVHKRHKDLTSTLADTIKATKSEGLVERYRKQAFGLRGDE